MGREGEGRGGEGRGGEVGREGEGRVGEGRGGEGQSSVQDAVRFPTCVRPHFNTSQVL